MARRSCLAEQQLPEYWRQRFPDKAAGELTALQPDGDAIVVSYRVPDGIVDAVLDFDPNGEIKIERIRCGNKPTALRPARNGYTWTWCVPCVVRQASPIFPRMPIHTHGGWSVRWLPRDQVWQVGNRDRDYLCDVQVAV
jgi:hypothetical protein